MYVLYVCMYVTMYVCMYVCTLFVCSTCLCMYICNVHVRSAECRGFESHLRQLIFSFFICLRCLSFFLSFFLSSQYYHVHLCICTYVIPFVLCVLVYLLFSLVLHTHTHAQLILPFIIGGLVILAYCAELKQAATYEKIMEQMFGHWMRSLTELCVFIYCFGTCVTFIVVIGDQVEDSKYELSKGH